MLSKIYSGVVQGIEAYPVEVEEGTGVGEPDIETVGLLDATVKESRERVPTATAMGFPLAINLTAIHRVTFAS